MLVATKCEAPQEDRQVDPDDLANHALFRSCLAHFKISSTSPEIDRGCLHAILKAAVSHRRGTLQSMALHDDTCPLLGGCRKRAGTDEALLMQMRLARWVLPARGRNLLRTSRPPTPAPLGPLAKDDIIVRAPTFRCSGALRLHLSALPLQMAMCRSRRPGVHTEVSPAVAAAMQLILPTTEDRNTEWCYGARGSLPQHPYP
jgi:hypothetical protein